MAAPEGNQNAKKSKVFHDAMRKACVQEDFRRINKGVEELLNKASEGERWALEMVRDTLDGKPKQQMEHGVIPGNPITDLLGRVSGALAVVPDLEDD